MKQTILVYGANGAQMNAGTKELINAGHTVRVLCRTEENAADWAAQGAETVIGEMSNQDSLVKASQGCDAIFLLVPLFRDSEELGITYGLNSLNAAKEAGITRVVWNTGGPIMDETSETDAGAVILRQLRANEFSFLGLTPITYMENLFGPWTLAGLNDGKLAYPTPVDFKMQWVAAKDFGRVADKALQGELPNAVLPLGGPAGLDGNDLARILGEALGKSLTFETMPAPEFQAYLAKGAGERVAGIVGGMYGAIQADAAPFQPGFVTDASDIEQRFGLTQTSLEDWSAEHKAILSA
ncbi:NmrA family NAD(P)-binding protein [Roseibium sp. MMSF_3412]|uniref:NmrA family NAD(P)-binding protein n=1 Tax=Roseibium sp. MMSF_3412 TaxID=3046712 RepID=UPI00273E5060|nr:NmrA family NAD(P)-binding protein [Roseibium sp. MMSF_3412]